jgi:hypothetical protein
VGNHSSSSCDKAQVLGFIGNANNRVFYITAGKNEVATICIQSQAYGPGGGASD